MKVVLDAGHGLHTPGKRTPDGEREFSFNVKVAKAAAARLAQYGATVIFTHDPDGSSDVSLAARVRKANASGADVFASLHHNALAGKWHNGGGTEVYTSNGASAKSNAIARAVAPKIAAAMGLNNRGHKHANFYVIRYTKMPAILVEGGFMDSRVDIKAMRNDAKLNAQGFAVADGIAEVFGLKLNGKVVPAVAEKAASALDYGKYLYGQTLSSGMRGVAVKRMQNDLTKLGYKTSADGIYGNGTTVSVKKFQAAHGLSVDGIAGPATQAAMRAALNAPKPKPASELDYGKYLYGQTLTPTMRGVAVERMQGDLNEFGYKTAEDGIYGPGTKASVAAFQRDHGLSVDGIAGPATQKAMRDKINAAKVVAKPQPAKDVLHRVIIDGVQKGAYSEDDNALEQARKALADGAKNIVIEEV